MNLIPNKWESRRIVHRFYADITKLWGWRSISKQISKDVLSVVSWMKLRALKNVHRYVLVVVIINPYFPHSWLVIRFVTRATRWVSIVEQGLRTLPSTLFLWDSCCSIFSFLCSVAYRSWFDRLSFFFWPFGHSLNERKVVVQLRCLVT